jgi:copper homeostasis protein
MRTLSCLKYSMGPRSILCKGTTHLPLRIPELEICAETPQACRAAFQGGAHRIEICTALNQGGVTPSHGLIRAAIEAGNGLPVYVLLRPRTGNFVYSEDEFRILCADLEHAATLGAAGFVTGILTAEGSVDEPRMREVVALAAGKEVTFHRAFDRTRYLPEALEKIVSAGCSRLLTSGGKPSAGNGVDTIVELAKQAGDRLRVAAGGGVTVAVAAQLRRMADVDVHVSLRGTTARVTAVAEDPLWNSIDSAADILVEDVERMAAIVRGSAVLP